MAARRYILKSTRLYLRCIRTIQVRNKSITGYQSADSALQTVTGGRINRWLDAYEDFVGLTEVRLAQEHVTKAENNYRCAQEERRATQHGLVGVQNKIKAVAMEIEKTQRGTDAYLDLVTKENEIIKEEKDILEKLSVTEENEKRIFALLSSALRESHEKERARAERMKYWGIIGSIIGAVIGIFGTTLNNYLRMKELRGIVTDATDMNHVYREKAMELTTAINEQYGKIYQLLIDVRSATGIAEGSAKHDSVKTVEQQPVLANDVRLDEVIAALKRQEETLDREIRNIGYAFANKNFDSTEGTVVYVGPEVEALLKETEKNIEWKMKIQTAGTVILVYSVAAIAVPALYKLFGGS